MPRDSAPALATPSGTQDASDTSPLPDTVIGDIRYRLPTAEDGAAVWSLIERTGGLDTNSLYCNLLQCSHFADTCVLAEDDAGPVGWVSAYSPPDDRACLFIWQVAVDPRGRGNGIASALLDHLVRRPVCRSKSHLHTTITWDNEASWALFRSFARRRGGELTAHPWFTRDTHFEGEHATEYLVSIAPLQALRLAA